MVGVVQAAKEQREDTKVLVSDVAVACQKFAGDRFQTVCAESMSSAFGKLADEFNKRITALDNRVHALEERFSTSIIAPGGAACDGGRFDHASEDVVADCEGHCNPHVPNPTELFNGQRVRLMWFADDIAEWEASGASKLPLTTTPST